MIWPAWFLRRVADAAAPLVDDDELAAAAAADLRVLAGLPGHRAVSGAWLEVVPWLPAYQGAVRLVLEARAGSDSPVGVPQRGRVRPGPDGVVPSAQLAAGGAGAVVSAATLLARIAEDDR